MHNSLIGTKVRLQEQNEKLVKLYGVANVEISKLKEQVDFEQGKVVQENQEQFFPDEKWDNDNKDMINWPMFYNDQVSMYALQVLTRDNFRQYPEVKAVFCQHEQRKHNDLQKAIQHFLFHLLSYPQPRIEAHTQALLCHLNENVNYKIVRASMNMVEYRDLHFEHDNQVILVTPGLLFEHGFFNSHTL